MLLDIRYSVRALTRRPGFAIAIVVTLSMAIAVNSALFDVVDLLLLRPPAHVQNPDRIGRLYFTRFVPGFGVNTQRQTSYPQFESFRSTDHSFSDVAATFSTDVVFNQAGADYQVHTALVSDNFFALLGMHPELGRFFITVENASASPAPEVIISYDLWQSVFTGNPSIVGREIQIASRNYTVIGVAPQDFYGIDLNEVELWLPLSEATASAVGKSLSDPRDAWLAMIGRLRAGASRSQAEAEATNLYRSLGNEDMRGDSRSQAIVVPLQAGLGPEWSKKTILALSLMGMAATILLVACANTANLLLQRGLDRRREIAIRLAIGIGGNRLARLLLIEPLLLGSLSGVIAVWLRYAGAPWVQSVFFGSGALPIDPWNTRVLAFTMLTSGSVGLACGILPVWQARSTRLSTLMKPGDDPAGRAFGKLRYLLLVGQVAFAVMLLVSGGVFVQSFWRLTRIDLGFTVDRLVIAKLDPLVESDNGTQLAGLYQRAAERLSGLSDARGVSLVSMPPFSAAMSIPVILPGQGELPPLPGGGPFLNGVDESYFAVMGVRLLQGRTFSGADRSAESAVAIVNATAARLFWPGQVPIGKCIHLSSGSSPCRLVVGVVSDARTHSVRQAPATEIFIPLVRETGLSPSALLIRTRGTPDGSIPAIRAALGEVSLGGIAVHPLSHSIEAQTRLSRASAIVFAIFGATALMLTLVGLYGGIAHAVALRRREIAIKIALGLEQSDAILSTVAGAAKAVGAGLIAGIACAMISTRLLTSLLYRTAPIDPLTIAAVVVLIAITSLVACYLPARAATKMSPARVLGHE